MKVRLKYVTTYSNNELVTKSSTVPDCLPMISHFSIFLKQNIPKKLFLWGPVITLLVEQGKAKSKQTRGMGLIQNGLKH